MEPNEIASVQPFLTYKRGKLMLFGLTVGGCAECLEPASICSALPDTEKCDFTITCNHCFLTPQLKLCSEGLVNKGRTLPPGEAVMVPLYLKLRVRTSTFYDPPATE